MRTLTRHRSSRRLNPVVVVFIFLAVVQESSAGVDFLVVEHADRLQIYNKYQQEASPSERQGLLPFTPMKILRSNDMLGDGFTPCMQVEIEGQIFYLVKENETTLAHTAQLGFEKSFRNTTILLDTLRILTAHAVRFSPVNSSPRPLRTGERVLRIFRHQGATYCRLMNDSPEYGWIDFRASKEGRDWKAITVIASSANPSSISALVSRIRARVNEVNSVLTRLVAFFNTQTQQRREAPRWTVETTGKTILCTISGAASGEFEESTFYLVNDIENIALGSTFQVTHTPGRIEIRRK